MRYLKNALILLFLLPSIKSEASLRDTNVVDFRKSCHGYFKGNALSPALSGKTAEQSHLPTTELKQHKENVSPLIQGKRSAEQNLQILMEQIQYRASISSFRLLNTMDPQLKTGIMDIFPALNSQQILLLLENLIKRRYHLITGFFDKPFSSFLIQTITERTPEIENAHLIEIIYTLKHLKITPGQKFVQEITKKVTQFNKNQLIEILYAFKDWGVKPSKKFIKAWRQTANKLSREFEEFERRFIRELLRNLGISPLKEPYGLNSSITKQDSRLSTTAP